MVLYILATSGGYGQAPTAPNKDFEISLENHFYGFHLLPQAAPG